MGKANLVLLAAAAAITWAVPAGARLVAPARSISWGKAGVSLETYRSDAIACGRQAAALDLRDTGPAKSLVLASRLIENATDVDSASNAMWIASPERNIGKAGDLIKAALDQCLIEKGYRQFRLSDAQRKKLAKLPTGSLERHTYLHSLASNPDILTRQAVN
jgi:hypothetical protein